MFFHPSALNLWVFFLKFFVEDPGGSMEEVQTAAPLVNLTNQTLLDLMEEDFGENKFYLPVRTTLMVTSHRLGNRAAVYMMN